MCELMDEFSEGMDQDINAMNTGGAHWVNGGKKTSLLVLVFMVNSVKSLCFSYSSLVFILSLFFLLLLLTFFTFASLKSLKWPQCHTFNHANFSKTLLLQFNHFNQMADVSIWDFIIENKIWICFICKGRFLWKHRGENRDKTEYEWNRFFKDQINVQIGINGWREFQKQQSVS